MPRKVSLPLLKSVRQISRENSLDMGEKFIGIDPRDVRYITCIGAGPIGAGWAAWFLARGYGVPANLHDMAEEESLRSLIDTAWISLESLGLAKGASRENLYCSSDLDEAVAHADFIQECAPEDLELKQSLYARLGEIVAPRVVIAASTSG